MAPPLNLTLKYQETASVKTAKYLTIILRNRAEYRLILSRRGRRPSWLKSGDQFRKIKQDNCFIIQHIDNKAQVHCRKAGGDLYLSKKKKKTCNVSPAR